MSQAAQQLRVDGRTDREADQALDDGSWEPLDEEGLHEALLRSLRDPVKLDARRILDDQRLDHR